MSESGLLVEVRWEWDGTELDADILLGATTAVVENPTVLSEAESVWIGETGPYDLLTVNEDTGAITFTPAASEDFEEGEGVTLNTGAGPAQVWVAEVVLTDADTPVEVPLTIRDLSVMPEGIYDPPKAVLLSDDLSEIIDLPGSMPSINAELLDPDSIVPGGLTPKDEFDQAVSDIEADLMATYSLVTGGASPAMGQIDDAIAVYLATYGDIDTQINNAITDFNTGLSTKSAHTLSASPPGTTPNNAGDVWEQQSGGAIIGRWRGAGGTSWVSMPLSSTYIPYLDAAHITTGTFVAERIGAKTIGVEKLIVSDLTNYWSDPKLEVWPDYSPVYSYVAEILDGYSPPSGGKSLVTKTGWSGSAVVSRVGTIPVKEGDEFTFEYDKYRVQGSYDGYIQLWGDPANTVVTILSDTQVKDYGTGWTRRRMIVRVQAGVTNIRPVLRVLHPSPYTDTRWAFSNLVLRRRLGGELVVDGSIYGYHIAANTIASEKLIISDFTNYIIDPSCTGTVAGGWTMTGGTYVDGTFPNVDGIADGVIVQWHNGAYQEAISNFFDVGGSNGQYYNLTLDVKGEASPNGTWLARIQWYNAVGAALTYTDIVDGSGNSSWTTRTGNAIAPANAVKGRLVLIRYGTNTTGFYIYDNVKLRRRFGGELIVDGTILARHVTADMVNGLIITGAAIQTTDNGSPSTWTVNGGAVTPVGIKITNTGMVGYGAAGSAQFVLSATTGRVMAVGGFATATGYGDVTIKPGNSALDPSALEFWPVRTGIDIGDGKRPSLSVWTEASIFESGWNAAMLRLQAPMGTSTTTRARIDFYTEKHPSTTAVKSHMLYHAGSQNPSALGRHYFYIDGNIIANVQTAGWEINGGKLAVGGVFLSTAPTNGIYAQGKIKTSNALECDTGLFDLSAPLSGWTGTNCQWNSNGRVSSGVSSGRFKQDIVPLPLEVARGALDLEAVSFQWRPEMALGEKRRAGFIAEQADDAGMELWLTRDLHDEPNGFLYAELTAAHNVLIRDLFARIEALEADRA